MQRTFETPGAISLYVELGAGNLRVSAEPVAETTVTVDGRDADEATVERRGDEVVVLAPHRKAGFFSPSSELRVSVVLPTDSELATKLGSADLVAQGRYATSRIRSGSGDLRIDELAAEAVVETGSGDVAIDAAHGDLRVKCGSGDVAIRQLGKSVVISTGSGDVTLGTAEHDVVVKSGSGDVEVKRVQDDLSVSTASGSLAVGTILRGTVKARVVSGDVRIGIPAGVPVWTDVSSVSGRVSSTLESAGRPEEGQDYVEIRATTVSGDIHLEQR